MYKLLLCWRYLRTRYLAMVCIVSVMLGVGTLIVVNAVMAGFSTKLRDRLHALLSDIVVEAYDYDGFADPYGKIDMIRRHPFLNERIEAMTPTLEIFSMFQYSLNGSPVTKTIRLIGIDPEGRKAVGGFAEYLLREDNRRNPSFELTDTARQRYEWMRHRPHRRSNVETQMQMQPLVAEPGLEPQEPLFKQPDWRPDIIRDLDKKRRDDVPAPVPPQIEIKPSGIVIGYALGHFRQPPREPGKPSEEITTLHPGDLVTIMTMNSQWKPVDKHFAVVDYFRSELSEYDAGYAFTSLDEMQRLRNLPDRATSIQIRLKDFGDAKVVTDRLKAMFLGFPVGIETWEDKQGPLLNAIKIEKAILNVLLFLIVGVAGFGILAIFSMIVIEKTRDIGVLKALGASNWGILGIFLGYGLLLGLVGSLMGTIGGVIFTWNINSIEKWLSWLTGVSVFSGGDVYYFREIPTDIQLSTIFLVNLGAVGIAVLFSILPALRAALLHPVQALRGE